MRLEFVNVIRMGCLRVWFSAIVVRIAFGLRQKKGHKTMQKQRQKSNNNKKIQN